MTMQTRRFTINRNLILDILRARNDDRIIRVEGIPDDAEVRDVQFYKERDRVVLFVETEMPGGVDLDVVVHDLGAAKGE